MSLFPEKIDDRGKRPNRAKQFWKRYTSRARRRAAKRDPEGQPKRYGHSGWTT